MIKYSIGNMKIGKDTIIINMSSATDCASKELGFCKIGRKCYALKAENFRKNCLPYRRAQGLLWNELPASQFIVDILKIARNKRSSVIKFVRFSESGDFRTQADVDKMSVIAEGLKRHGIRVFTYTARQDLCFNGVSDNLVVNGSSFMIHNSFTAVQKGYGEMPEEKRCAGDCRACSLCKVRGNFKIVNAYH